jgi:hypothetical protein
MRELLRAQDVVVSRRPGLEWQDALAQAAADRVSGGEDPREVWTAFVTSYEAGSRAKDWRHIRWALQDGLDRAVYTAIKTSKLNIGRRTEVTAAESGAALSLV